MEFYTCEGHIFKFFFSVGWSINVTAVVCEGIEEDFSVKSDAFS